MQFNFGSPIQILVNSREVQIGQPCQRVISLQVFHQDMGLQVQKGEGKKILTWLYDLVERCESEWIEYQGVLILKEEVQEYKGR